MEPLINKAEFKPSPNGKFKECWWWTGAKNDRGYGHTQYCGELIKVHRLSAHLWLGFDLNSKLEVCHECDNPPCFNPKHLFIGTHKENMDDAISKGIIVRGIGGQFNSDRELKVDIEDIKSIIELKKEGISSKEIADIFKISISHVNRLIKKGILV